MQGFIRNNLNIIFILILILFSLYALSPFINSGLPLTHDGIDHVARIANFYEGLLDGNLIPRWGANLNWGYGHPVLMFLYPLSSYIASLFHFVGFNFENSVKLVFVLAYILSGITMYFWSRKHFGNYSGLLISLLYILSPYRFIDMYVRGAIGEHVAFIFPPLVKLFLYKLFFDSKNQLSIYKNFLGVSFSSALLILGHNAISIMFLPLIIAYSLYLSLITKKLKILIVSFTGIVFGFLLSAFFLVPAFVEGKYTLRDIVTGNEYMSRFVEPIKFLYGDWNFGITGQFSVQLGLVHLLGLMCMIAVIFYKKKKLLEVRNLQLIFLFFFLLSIFLQIKQANFLYEIFTTLKKFQFPWRFLSLSVFTISIISGSFLILIKGEKIKVVILSLVLFLLIVQSKTFIDVKGYFSKPDSYYRSIYKSTTDTGESSPIWSVRFMEKEPAFPIELIDGNGQIRELKRSSTLHLYNVNINSNSARIVDNTLYFPGWKVYVDNVEQKIEFQDQLHRGLITFQIPKGTHEIKIQFTETKLRLFSNLISTAAFTMLFLGIIYFYFKNEKT